MQIQYRDDIGVVVVEVSPDGVSFLDGMAYFDGLDGKSYKIEVDAIDRVW